MGGWSLPAGNLRHGCGRRKPLDCGIRDPRSMRWGMGAMLCPIKHYPTLRYFGVEVLRGILLQFWGPELRDRPTDTLTDGQAVLGAKTDLLETHCGGIPLAECQKSRWNALQNHLIYAVLSYFTCIFCIALTFDLCCFCENEHGSESGSVRTSMVVRAGV